MVDARVYHERTNHSPASIRASSHTLDESNRPRPAKRYRDVPRLRFDGIRPVQQPGVATIAVSRSDPLPAEATRVTPLDRTALATICYDATGITQTISHRGSMLRFRAASCTGKLYHVDLYLICGALDGLDAGVYHVDPEAFGLDVLRTGDYRGVVRDALGDPEGSTGAPDAYVILTSTWWRNAWKYRERTYRHAFWDGGTIVANLLASAHGQDQRAECIGAFHDGRLADLIGIDPDEEAPIAAVALGSDDRPADPPPIEPIDPDTHPLSRDPKRYQLIVDAWEQSTLSGGETAAAWRSDCRTVGRIGVDVPSPDRPVDLEPVDPDTASARPLYATIKRRGSTRSFSPTGPTARQVGTILDRSLRGVPGDWNGGLADGPSYLDCYLLVTNVDGLEDGRYHLEPRTMRAERLGGTSPERKRRLALNQRWAGEAHVNVYLMADIDTIVDILGNRGYRLAQFEAGITLGRLYLATAAHRALGGTGLTFFDEMVTEELSPRASEQTPMCLFAFGRTA